MLLQVTGNDVLGLAAMGLEETDSACSRDKRHMDAEGAGQGYPL